MAKGNKKLTRSERKDELERKRDERCRRNALKKERKTKEYLEHDENFVSFSNQLQALGLKIKDVLGDGNCLFRALGDQLEGDHTSHGRHRRETVRYMKEHRDDFEPFMEDNISFEIHLKELSQLGTYGGNDSIVAFARNNGVDINIHQLNEPQWVISGSQYSRTSRVPELHISYHNGDHYSSVRSISDPDGGPAWPYHNQGSTETKTLSSVDLKNKKGKPKQRLKQSDTAAGKAANPGEACDQNTFHSHNSESLGEACGESIMSKHENDLFEAEQAVMAATGCKDLVIVAQSLEENGYNVDAAVGYILQLMCIAEEQGFSGNNHLLFNGDTQDVADKKFTHDAKASELENVQFNEPTPDSAKEAETACSESNEKFLKQTSTCSDTLNCKSSLDQSQENLSETKERATLEVVENLTDSLDKVQCPKSALQNNQGARPKVSRTRQGHGQAHLSNKKRKELAKQEKKKRRMEERKQIAGQLKTNQSATVEKSLNAVVPDLGALAI